MVDLVKFLVLSIATNDQLVTVDSQPGEGDSELIVISVAPEDMGRVIGKHGKIISAIRELVKVAAVKAGKRARVVLKDLHKTDQDYPPAPSESPSQSSQS